MMRVCELKTTIWKEKGNKYQQNNLFAKIQNSFFYKAGKGIRLQAVGV